MISLGNHRYVTVFFIIAILFPYYNFFLSSYPDLSPLFAVIIYLTTIVLAVLPWKWAWIVNTAFFCVVSVLTTLDLISEYLFLPREETSTYEFHAYMVSLVYNSLMHVATTLTFFHKGWRKVVRKQEDEPTLSPDSE